jgi:ubiquinone/menaquinone biosynthesis C-methylase UbiE
MGQPMFSQTPDLYDAIYRSFKDYAAEAEQIAGLLKAIAPNARTVLDVACGTGEHARHLRATHGYEVSGLDIEPAFVRLARNKLPDATFWHADMVDFDVGVHFDVVMCLFSSIGYLCQLDRVERALRCFRRHLAPGGVVLVEPWFPPDAWNPGRIHVHTGESENLKVVRMSHSGVEGRISTIEFHYLIGTERGIDHRVEHHELGLFTTAELREAFRQAGFTSVEYDAQGLTGRGLFVAR